MGSFFNKALQFFSKNWKRIVTPLGTLVAGFFFGNSLGKRGAETEISKLQKVIRKHEAELIAFESIQKKSFRDKRKIRELETKIRKLETQKDSLSKPPKN